MDGQYGPYRQIDLVQMTRASQIDAESLVWRDGLETWTPMRSVPELAADLPEEVAGEVPKGKASIPPKGYGLVGSVLRFWSALFRPDVRMEGIHDFRRGAWVALPAGWVALAFWMAVRSGLLGEPAGLTALLASLGAVAAGFAGAYGAARFCVRRDHAFRHPLVASGLLVLPWTPGCLLGGVLGLFFPPAVWIAVPAFLWGGFLLSHYFLAVHKARPGRAGGAAVMALTLAFVAGGLLENLLLGTGHGLGMGGSASVEAEEEERGGPPLGPTSIPDEVPPPPGTVTPGGGGMDLD